MPPRICPSCRLLAIHGEQTCIACSDATVEPRELAKPAISGVTTLVKKPATGWRDTVALLGTAFGMLGATATGAFAFGAPGLLLGPVVGLFGYTKQFWRTAFRRRDRVASLPHPRPPVGERLLGIAQPHERQLEIANAPPQPFVVATTVCLDGGMLARRIESVPFWLVLADGRRMLVDGVAWLASAARDQLPTDGAKEGVLASEVPLTRRERKRITVERTLLSAGDSLSICGPVTPMQLPGAGYRDHLVDAIVGERGSPIWLEKLSVDPAPH